MRFVQEDIRTIVQKIESGCEMVNQRKSVGYSGIIWHMVNCSLFEELFFNEGVVELLLGVLASLDSVPPSAYEFAEQDSSYANTLELIKNTYMQTLEKLFNNITISEKLQDYYSTKVLPSLVQRLLTSLHQDIKFNCIKFVLYLITFYLNEENLYDSTVLNATSTKVSTLLTNTLLPSINTLLTKPQNEAVSTMTIKLLVVLFDINVSFIRKFQEMNKMQIILDNGYFQEGTNTNVLKLIQKCVSVEPTGVKPVPGWVSAVFTQNYKILMNSLETGQELLVDSSLEIFRELMRINGKNWKQEDIENIWEKALPLQGHEDLVIREKAESVIEAIL
jgi:hypothetical protein